MISQPNVDIHTADADSSVIPPIPHIPRTFNEYKGAQYVLPSDDKETARLKLQHDVLKAAFDGTILQAPFENNASYFVLDSGAGSGAWTLDMASQLSPSAILHGTDIEGRLFPKVHPPNVSFSKRSVTSLPQEWTGKFDYVHQRLLVAALTSTEWPKALAEIFRSLSPGGWVQISEVGKWHGGPATERHASLLRSLFKARGLLIDVSTMLPELLHDAQFVDIRIRKRTIPLGAWAGQLGADARDNFIGVFRGMKTPILRAGGLGYVKSEEEFDAMLDDVEEEWNVTRNSEIEFYVFYARKPAA